MQCWQTQIETPPPKSVIHSHLEQGAQSGNHRRNDEVQYGWRHIWALEAKTWAVVSSTCRIRLQQGTHPQRIAHILSAIVAKQLNMSHVLPKDLGNRVHHLSHSSEVPKLSATCLFDESHSSSLKILGYPPLPVRRLSVLIGPGKRLSSGQSSVTTNEQGCTRSHLGRCQGV